MKYLECVLKASTLALLGLAFWAQPTKAQAVIPVPSTDSCYMSVSIDNNANLRSAPYLGDNVLRETERTMYGRLSGYVEDTPWFLILTNSEYGVLSSYWVHEVNIQTAYSYCPTLGIYGEWIRR